MAKAVKRGGVRRLRPKKVGAKGAPSASGDNVRAEGDEAHVDRRGQERVRIVAIGASAGGLEPIEQFFEAMGSDSGLAFVVIQHLSPDHKSLMDELLARRSSMTIRHIENGMRLEANTLYLNPPRTELTLSGDRLYTREEDQAQLVAYPIDTFLHCLAEERGESAVGIILSGTGTDGGKGAAAIRQAGGLVLVQEPGSAKFDSMPRTILERDIGALPVLPVDMPALVLSHCRGEPIASGTSPVPAPETDPEGHIFSLLQQRYGADFGYYKRSTVDRRLARRASIRGAATIEAYAKALSNDSDELEALYSDLLIGVTSFFRDKAAFQALAETVIPNLMSTMSDQRQIRVWIPGCASGEEAYTIAILFSEAARQQDLELNLKIFATDIHFKSLSIAARGVYEPPALGALEPELLERYFEATRDGYRVRSALRRHIIFSQQNIIRDAPFLSIDLVSCRNLLIYLDERAQRKVFALFHFSLAPRGYLLLGPSETAGELADEFEVVDGRWRILQKRRDINLSESMRLLPNSSRHAAPVRAPADSTNRPTTSAQVQDMVQQRRLMTEAYEALIARYAPSSLLVNERGDLVHVVGDASKHIRLKPGMFSARAADMMGEPLRSAFSSVFERARTAAANGVATTQRVRQTIDGEPVEIAVEALKPKRGPQGFYIVTFESLPTELAERPPLDAPVDMVMTAAFADRIAQLEGELRINQESLQNTIEQLETSNEELQASNEELMAANEELQSTNEELHSVNEELYTVSAEHRAKINELSTISADLDNLLRSTDIGVVFIDRDMRIRSLTPSIESTFNLMPRDKGRPIEHVTTRFSGPHLKEAMWVVLETGITKEFEVRVGSSHYLLRILPYRQEGGTIAGIVLVAIDITFVKRAENLEEFAAVVAHDLKAPLRAIKRAGDWIVEDLGPSVGDGIRAHVGRLAQQTQRMEAMLDDLLVYARTGREALAVERVDLAELIEEVARIYDSGQLQLDVSRPLPTIDTHSAPLRLVLQNLIDNAVKYSDSAPASVRIVVIEDDDKLTFQVSDDGPGIEPRYQSKIFLPFRKLERPEEKPGTGMGLALARRAVETHNGVISVASNPAERRGTTFTFTWPKRIDDDTMAQVGAAVPGVRKDTGDQH